MVRMFAQLVGVVLILVGIVGFFAGDATHHFLTLNVDTVENIVHLITGAAFLYAGFGVATDAAARPIVMALGIIYLLVFLISLFNNMLFGLVANGYTILDDIIHLVVGLASLAVAYMKPAATRPVA